MTSQDPCPCGSKKNYSRCCAPFHQGKKEAPTAEAQMRARYSAFARADVEYIMKTLHPKTRDDQNEDDIRAWAEGSEWKKLEILECHQGGESDSTGQVEFLAQYVSGGEVAQHHELSDFEKLDGRWYFKDGRMMGSTVQREGPRIGRNDPCPCGSGKKHKKCCLKA